MSYEIDTSIAKEKLVCSVHELEAKYCCIEKNCSSGHRAICAECIAADGEHYLH